MRPTRESANLRLCLLAILSAAVLWAALPMARAIQGDGWEQDIRAFEAQDRKNPPPPNPIVFVGSSSIVRWDLKKFFPGLNAINRGFGGSEMIDSAHYADRIVIPYKPRVVVLYAGDNDLAGGTTPEQVEKNFEAFVQKVHGALPQTKIVVISVKPSIARWSIVGKMRATNALMRAYCEKHDHLAFVDIAPQMEGSDGKPRPELFVGDGLHMTGEGYKIWTEAVRPHLQ